MINIITPLGSLDLPADLSIEVMIENPLFLQDSIPTPYSINIDLPVTNNNRRILQLGNIPTADILGQKTAAEIHSDGLPFLIGTIELENRYMGTERAVSIIFIGAFIPDKIDEDVDISTQLKSWHFGNIKNNYTNFTKVRDLLNSAIAGNEVFVSAPIRMKNRKMADEDYFNEIMRGIELYANYYNPTMPDVVVTGTNWMGGVYPCIKISYLLSVIFQGSLTADIFDREPFNRLVVICTYLSNPSATELEYALDVTDPLGSPDYYLDLTRRIPRMNAGDFATSALKLMCASLFPFGYKWTLKLNNDVINDTYFIDWSDKVEDDYFCTTDSGKAYTISFVGAESENADIDKTLPKITAADEKTMLRSDRSTEVAYFYLHGGTIVYKRTVGATGICSFELVKRTATAAEAQYTSDTYDVSIDFKPVKKNMLYANVNRTKKGGAESFDPMKDCYWMVPEIDFPDTEDGRPDDVYVGIYHGKVTAQLPAGVISYPYISDDGIDINGNSVGFSLLDGPAGLLNYHKDFADYIARPKMVMNRTVNLSIIDIKNIDVSKKVMINGTLFFIKTLSIRFNRYGILPCEAEFIEA